MTLWYDKEAYTLLKKCSDNHDMTEWNIYREETKHNPINLRFTNLEKFDLQDCDLKYVDLRGANFNKTKCTNSDVSYTNISKTFDWKTFLLHILFTLIGVYLLVSNLEIDPKFMKDLVEIIGNNIFIGLLVGIVFSAIFVLILLLVIVRLFNVIQSAEDISLNVLLTISILNSLIGIYIVYEFSSIGASAFGIGIGIIILTYMLFLIITENMYIMMQESIAHAKNPKNAIGFETKYLKGITTPLSVHTNNEITIVKELLEKEQDEKEKQELQEKLEELQKEKKEAVEKEAHTKTQQIKIQNALNHILKPYEYMEKNINKLRKHNYFFYGIILILLSVFIYALLHQYLDTRSEKFISVLNKESISFGAIFGVILFYATPILFGMSIIVYGITQINKNLQSMEVMQEQRRSIEVLQSTLLAQTEIADVSDDEIKALTQALQKGALEKMFGRENAKENTDKEKSSYREKLMANNLSKVLIQALKN